MSLLRFVVVAFLLVSWHADSTIAQGDAKGLPTVLGTGTAANRAEQSRTLNSRTLHYLKSSFAQTSGAARADSSTGRSDHSDRTQPYAPPAL